MSRNGGAGATGSAQAQPGDSGAITGAGAGGGGAGYVVFHSPLIILDGNATLSAIRADNP